MENLAKIGVVEGFFGPAWPEAERRSYAAFIQETGGGFYIYAPKQDPHLRKKWREPWSPDYLGKLRSLAEHFKSHGVTFGVGLSPFGLGKALSPTDHTLLANKLRELQDVGVELLGLFFDDMPSDQDLAATQIACMKLVRQSFHNKIVFCPSYYTPDPILDKVFGQRPENYLRDIAEGIPPEVSLAWTGPKVISPEIPLAHILEVKAMLKRSPFIWENVFANDGPKNCKFLKLKPFSGRGDGVYEQSEAFAFNMMNQPELSKITFLASRLVLEDKMESEAAYSEAIKRLCSAELGAVLRQHNKDFLERGLDNLSAEEKSALLDKLAENNEPAALEIIAWLKGEYIVGSECLTD